MGRQAEVVLQARIDRRDLKFPSVKVEIKRNAIKLPIECNFKGKPFAFEPESIMGFYMRYRNNGADQSEPIGKRVVKPLGKDPVAAYTQYVNFEADFERVSRGLAPIQQAPETNGDQGLSLVQAVAKWKHDLTAENKKPRTVTDYMSRVQHLVNYFDGRNVSLKQITADDMRKFLLWLQKHIQRRPGSEGNINNTLRNILRDVKIMMKRFGVEMPLENKYWPKPMPKRKRKYSVESIKAMLKVVGEGLHDNNRWSGEDERDLVHFLLNTGFRDEEVAHADYGWINFQKGTINVYAQPKYNWTPKDNESRSQDIDLSDKFLQRMKARMERHKAKNSDLIFPNTLGKPYLNEGLLNVIRRLIKRAELEDKASLHMFRKTFGTMVANKRGLEQARIWLGHEDVQTTQAYLAADEWTSPEESRAQQQEIFSAVGD
jgi:integrase